MASATVGYHVREQYIEPNQLVSQLMPEIQRPSVEILDYSVNPTNGIEDRLVFDLIDAPPSHANALRRTLISSVPSVAIEIIGIVNNTGVMPDEVLCHRIGLVPINVDPSFLEFSAEPCTDNTSDPETTLLFGMRVKCGKTETHLDGDVDATNEGNLPVICVGPSGEVNSGHLIWMPFEGQRERFGNIRPLYDDIPITKIVPGQELHLYCRAIKSIGSDHAKFSPVCTAFYRMIPQITVDESASAEDLVKLRDTCHVGVFDIEDTGKINAINHRKCTTCRECLRNPETAAIVKVDKLLNRYEFTVESVGVRPAPTLVKEAFQILGQRCRDMRNAVQQAISQ